VRDGLADHGAQGCNVRGGYDASQQSASYPANADGRWEGTDVLACRSRYGCLFSEEME
jgi:hypothetical protein